VSRISTALSFSILFALAGCATKANVRPFASIWRVREEVSAEVSDAFHDAGRGMAKTWSDVWHDWNYADDGKFGDIRDAAGH